LIYLDANVIIRLIEGAAVVRAPLEARILASKVPGAFLLTSRLSLLECRSKPLKSRDPALLALYDGFFAAAELTVAEITPAVINTATRLRASHNFKSPDAIHVATAIEAGASVFLSADKDLARCREIKVELL
jgi:uncharacterized protein